MLHPSSPSIAILNLLGDYSFNAYNFGLAEGLGKQGIDVDLYTCGDESMLAELPATLFHKRLNVMGAFLFRQRASAAPAPSEPPVSSPAPVPGANTWSVKSILRKPWIKLRPHLMTHELLWQLRKSGRTILWTQWPDMDPYLENFWDWAHRYGFILVHTVHNVLPHEVHPGDRERMEKVYEKADLLWVHSQQSQQLLLQEFPQLDPQKIAIYPIGLYSMFKRLPEKRESVRQELSISPNQPMLLACGLIRPYKNLDSVLTAIAAPEFAETVLTIAGRESGFPDSDRSDPLRRTRQAVERLGITGRVRLIPRFLSNDDLSALFEAADALLLPYKEGYGSGQLVMGMTFEKHLLTTPIGGSEEYLMHYPNHTMVQEPDPEHLRTALRSMLPRIHPAPAPPVSDLTALHWDTVGGRIKEILASRFPA